MVIWKEGLPYIVRDVDDLRQVIDEEIFNQVRELIEEYVEENDKVSVLESEIEDLNDEIYGLEEELQDVSNALEELKKQHKNNTWFMERVTDFMESIENCTLNKEQWYYFDRLQDALKSIEQ